MLKIPEFLTNIQLFKAKSSIVFVFLCLVLSVSLYRSIIKIKSAEQKIEDAKHKVENLAKENEEMLGNLESMKSDDFIEKQLRDKLGLAKEGEIVLILPEDDVLRKLVPKEIPEEEILPDPNWEKWFQLFGFNK